MAAALPRTLGELQLYRILQKANLLSYFDAFIQQGGDDVQQLCEAGEEEFLEIMALVGMASKPLHVRRLQKALRDWVTNPGLFNQPLTSLPVSSIPIYKLPEGSPAWLGVSCSSYDRGSSAREPHLKIPKCAAATCVQSLAQGKADAAGSVVLPGLGEARLWQGHHAPESEHSLSPADLGSPASPRESSEALDAAAALSVAECVERLAPSLPRSDAADVRELLRSNKKLAKMVGHIFDMSDDDPRKEEEIRKYSAIYGRFDSKRKDGKHLTLHEVRRRVGPVVPPASVLVLPRRRRSSPGSALALGREGRPARGAAPETVGVGRRAPPQGRRGVSGVSGASVWGSGARAAAVTGDFRESRAEAGELGASRCA